MKFIITAKRGIETIATIHGRNIPLNEKITVADLERIIEIEQFLERLTGLRFHIDSSL